MATKQKGTYALVAILLLTATSVGMSVDGYPAGGDQQGAGEDWAKDSIAHGCSCHMDEQLDEGMYRINGIPTKYVPDTTYNISLVINDTNVISEPDADRYGGFLAEVSEGAFQTNELFWVGDDGT